MKFPLIIKIIEQANRAENINKSYLWQDAVSPSLIWKSDQNLQIEAPKTMRSYNWSAQRWLQGCLTAYKLTESQWFHCLTLFLQQWTIFHRLLLITSSKYPSISQWCSEVSILLQHSQSLKNDNVSSSDLCSNHQLSDAQNDLQNLLKSFSWFPQQGEFINNWK